MTGVIRAGRKNDNYLMGDRKMLVLLSSPRLHLTFVLRMSDTYRPYRIAIQFFTVQTKFY